MVDRESQEDKHTASTSKLYSASPESPFAILLARKPLLSSILRVNQFAPVGPRDVDFHCSNSGPELQKLMPYTHGSDACHNFCQTMLMEYSNVPGAPHGQTPCFSVCQRNCGDVFGSNFEPDCEPSAGPGSPDTCTGWGMRFEHRREHNGVPVDLYCHNEWYYGVKWTNLA